MDRNLRNDLRGVAGIEYEYSQNGILVTYNGVALFKLSEVDGTVLIAYIPGLLTLSPEYDKEIIDILKKCLNWD